jgi:hypothetical protein
MIFMLIALVWMLMLALLAVLCMAARLGDLAEARTTVAASAPTSWGPAERVEITAHASLRLADDRASFVRGEGLAASARSC